LLPSTTCEVPVRSAVRIRRLPEAGNKPGDEGREEHLAGHGLDDRYGHAVAARGGEVAVAKRSQRGEAEVLVGLDARGLPVREERAVV
jgi:hypothetical protein